MKHRADATARRSSEEIATQIREQVEAEEWYDERYLARLAKQDPDMLLFTDYIVGYLSAQQKAAFEERLASDEALREWALPLLELRESVRSSSGRELGELLLGEDWQRQERTGRPASGSTGRTEPVAPPSWRRMLAIALIVVTLTILAYLLLPLIASRLNPAPDRIGDRWDVQEFEPSPETIRYTTTGSGALWMRGPAWVAAKRHETPAVRGRQWRMHEVMLGSELFTVDFAPLPDGDSLLLTTPQVVIRTQRATYSVRRLSRCSAEVLNMSLGGALLLASPRSPEKLTSIPAGESGYVLCDGSVELSTGARPYSAGDVPPPTGAKDP